MANVFHLGRSVALSLQTVFLHCGVVRAARTGWHAHQSLQQVLRCRPSALILVSSMFVVHTSRRRNPSGNQPKSCKRPDRNADDAVPCGGASVITNVVASAGGSPPPACRTLRSCQLHRVAALPVARTDRRTGGVRSARSRAEW